MWRLWMLVVLSLAFSACAHRQPKARCTGPLERINVAAPAHATDPRPETQGVPREQQSQEEESEP
jgi:hypothetical protein